MDKKDLLEIKKLFKYPDCSFSQIGYAVVNSLEYDEEPALERIAYTGQSKFLTREDDEQKTFLTLLNKAFCFQESVTSSDFKVSGDIKRLLSSFSFSEPDVTMALEPFAEKIISDYPFIKSFAIVLFKGAYDIPIKDESKTKVGESDEVYNYIAVMVCPIEAAKVGLSPLDGDIKRGDIVRILKQPLFGIMYPSFSDRASDDAHAFVCCRGEAERTLASNLFAADVPAPEKKEKAKITKFTLTDDDISPESFDSEVAADIINDIKTGNVTDFKEHLKTLDKALSDIPSVNSVDDALLSKRAKKEETEEEDAQIIEVKEDRSVVSQNRITERDINGKSFFIIPKDLIPPDMLEQLLLLSEG